MRSRHIVGRLVAALVALFALGIFAVSPAAAADGDTLEIDLNGLNDYDFNGTATITEENGAVTVEIQVEGADVVGGHPVHIHLGTCNELDPNPTYSLADIDADGQSTTLVDGVTLDDLLAEPYAINAHLSATDIPTYVSCGNIAPAAEGGDDEEATTRRLPRPTTRLMMPPPRTRPSPRRPRTRSAVATPAVRSPTFRPPASAPLLAARPT